MTHQHATDLIERGAPPGSRAHDAARAWRRRHHLAATATAALIILGVGLIGTITGIIDLARAWTTATPAALLVASGHLHRLLDAARLIPAATAALERHATTDQVTDVVATWSHTPDQVVAHLDRLAPHSDATNCRTSLAP